MYDEPPAEMMTEMDQETLNDEAGPISEGEADDMEAAEYANGMGDDAHAIGVGVMDKDPARHEEHKEADERKGAGGEPNKMTGESDDMEADKLDKKDAHVAHVAHGAEGGNSARRAGTLM